MKRRRGQAVTEFAIAAPVMLFVLLGVVDLVPVFISDVRIQDAAREGARHGVWYNTTTHVNPYLDDTDIVQAANDELQGATTLVEEYPPSTNLNCPSFPVPSSDYPPSGGAWIFICYNGTAGATSAQPGQNLAVIATQTVPTVASVPMLPGPVKIEARQVMMIQGGS